MTTHKACHCCGQIHWVPPLAQGQSARCVRCGATVASSAGSDKAASRTAAAAVAALVLFWPAILLPILEIERLGHRHTSSILTGTLELISHGNWLVGGIVLVFSIVFPLTKILLLLELSLLELLQRRHKGWTYRVMELVGKWSMLDVLLLAFLVMLVKLGSLVEFRVGPAVVAFVLCVAMSMVSSMCFDPHSVWKERP